MMISLPIISIEKISFYKCINQTIKRNNEIYTTRSRGKIRTWKVRTTEGVNGNKALNAYNTLPEEILKNNNCRAQI